MPIESPAIRSILVTDVGSTTTKAILIEKVGDEYRLVTRGEMPTTVERPWENVMIGVRKSIKRVAELVDRPLLADGDLIRPKQNDRGVDLYLSTSSAGGGLQMMVCGVVSSVSASSAHRAALGAGAVVLDVIAVDDGRSTSEQITRITQLRPDIILMSGGTDGGAVQDLAAIAEMIVQANPQPRFGSGFKLPLIYAGNVDAQDLIRSVSADTVDVHCVENLRPAHDTENLGPARELIHRLFMEHVMAQAPGYDELIQWADTTVMPTPGAVGSIISLMAERYQSNIVGVDIGGATTDVFSAVNGVFTRTVSANLGMSYSICNVLEEASWQNIRRWIPFAVDEDRLGDWVANKMIRPTTLPETMETLILEQAICREALRLSFDHHKSLARKVEKQKVADWNAKALFDSKGEELIKTKELDMLVGSGGVLSHAPRREQAAMMLMDAFLPEGITQLAVDSIFMMPHLGVLSSIHPEIAVEVFDKDCLVRLGTCIAPIGKGREATPVLDAKITFPDGRVQSEKLTYGGLKRIELGVGEKAMIELIPQRGFDLGIGAGKTVTRELEGGLVGLIFDLRGRPFELPQSDQERMRKLSEWLTALNVYPAGSLNQRREPLETPVATKDEGGQNRGLLARLFGRK